MAFNISTADRVIRVIVGLALLAAMWYGTGPLRWIGALGGVALATGLAGHGPLYSVFGFSSCGPASRQR